MGLLVAVYLAALTVSFDLGTVAGADRGPVPLLHVYPAPTAAGGTWLHAWTGWLHGPAWIFAHEVLGFGGAFILLPSWSASGSPMVLVPTLATSAVFLSFLDGGILLRLARRRRVGSAGFFSACGVFFVRFLWVGALSGAMYYALFRWALPAAFRLAGPSPLDRSTTPGRAAVSWLLLAVVLGLGLVIDLAKVRAVVEDRRSMVGAIAASLRFIRLLPGRAVALYLLNGAILWLLILPARLAIVGATPMWMLHLLGWATLLAVLVVRLAFMASETALFQAALAHAGYVAVPPPVWPDSPSADPAALA